MTSAIYLFLKGDTFITADLAIIIDENFHQCSWSNQPAKSDLIIIEKKNELTFQFK